MKWYKLSNAKRLLIFSCFALILLAFCFGVFPMAQDIVSAQNIGKAKSMPFSIEDSAPKVWLEFGWFQKTRTDLPDEGKELVEDYWRHLLEYIKTEDSDQDEQVIFNNKVKLIGQILKIQSDLNKIKIDAPNGHRALALEEVTEILKSVSVKAKKMKDRVDKSKSQNIAL